MVTKRQQADSVSPRERIEVSVAVTLIVIGIAIIFLQVIALQQQLNLKRYMKEKIAMPLDQLKDAIEHATSVQTAAVALIRRIADELAGLRPDEAEIRRLAGELRQRADELASAIAEHEEDEEDGEDAGPASGTRR